MKKYLYNDLYITEEKHWWHISKRRSALQLLSLYSKNKHPKILDVGCGTGKNIEELGKIGVTWGIDNSKEAIFYCKKRGLNNVLNESIYKTTFKPNFFDVITIFDVLEHTDDEKALKEISRILKPGGLLIITVPAYNFLWSQWDVELFHLRRYSLKSLKTLLKSKGFAIKKISYKYSFLLVPIYLVRKFKSKFSKNNYGSDFKLNISIINSLLYNLSEIENFIIKYWSIPFGTSIICVSINEK